MSLCIAATCRYEGSPCVVHCCDTAGTRGDVKSEDIIKISHIGDSTVLLAGNMSHAKELLVLCRPYINNFKGGSNDLAITTLKRDLTEAVRLRKRAISTAVLSAELGITYDEVFNWSQAHPSDPTWIQAWQRIRELDLGAALVVSTFTDDEAAILTIEPNGYVIWNDHYAAVGTGSNIAAAFLQQRDYHDAMEVEECLYRVLEAKTAAEKNPYVGNNTILEFRTLNFSHILHKSWVNRRTEIIRRRRSKRIECPLDKKFITTFNPNLPDEIQ